ncbi:DUF3656 domain-containing U32 family peptidase [Peptostreptococcus faecalis]|uniref:DUF3656 domain-containing U32 family peptidase n=1 Tax=Peptostreptococcus faecalis TaxID=2045015 RepID=UPI000C7B4822|nr:U32 family peptidase [Peptostreptococcus faecalis]
MKENLELLAPVGSFESLKAAIQNGANAVYLGGKDFSARASANNFDREELKEAVIYSHIRGCRVFVTANTVIKQSEIQAFLEYIDYLYNIGVDALILQDIGMAQLVKGRIPDFELHASTQMSAHSLEDTLFLKKMGFKRVVLARELNVKEIKEIADKSGVDIEVFIHGALCVGYSGQCLMSSTLGTRSGNRGRCAQPCRQKYKLYDSVKNEYMDFDGEFILSPKDLNTVSNIGSVIDANAVSLKIEGRMKRPEYVAAVVGAYRKAVDNYIDTKKENVTEDMIDDLYTIFNRKFTQGYILGDNAFKLMNPEKPNNRGLYIGEVISFNPKRKRLKIKLEKDLKKGDALNIGGGTIGRIIKGKDISEYALAGEIIEIDYVGSLKKGTKIFKTSDKNLIDRVQKTYEEGHEKFKLPIKANITLKIGEKGVLMFSCRGVEVSINSNSIVEKAIKVPMTEQRAVSQISKLGKSPFYIADAISEIDEGISIPISELNNMRREAILELSEQLSKVNGRKYVINKNEYEIVDEKNDYVDDKQLNISCKNLEQLKAIVDFEIDNIYYRDINTLENAIEIASKKGKKISYYMPRILRNSDKKVYKKLLEMESKTIEKLDSFRVSNYGEINFIKENYPHKNIRISSWMNVFNDSSIEFYKKLGADKICLSQEMSIYQIENLQSSLNNVEYLVYGQTDMMISEYCPVKVSEKGCRTACNDKECKKEEYYLESGDGSRYRLSKDGQCRTIIHSEEIVNLVDEIEKLEKSGLNSFEISFEFEDSTQTSKVVEMFINKINGDSTLDYAYNDKVSYCTGHFYKEID